MLKRTTIALTLSITLLFAIAVATPLRGVSAQSKSHTAHSAVAAETAVSSTLQKMIVESGSVTMNLDLNAFNGDSSLVARPVTLQFVAAANSFLPVLVFNDFFRSAEPGSMALIPAGISEPSYSLPETLSESLKQLVVEKLSS